jgi:hypothetical protein
VRAHGVNGEENVRAGQRAHVDRLRKECVSSLESFGQPAALRLAPHAHASSQHNVAKRSKTVVRQAEEDGGG